MVKIFLFFYFIFSFVILKAQILAPLNPYKCDLGLYYSIDKEKEIVLKHKIKSISTHCFEKKKNGTYKLNGRLIKTINFDQFGNPLFMNLFSYKDYRWINNFRNHVEKYEYLMEYDSLNRFVRTCEKLHKNNETTLNETFYFYNENGERESEKGTSKYIYKKKPSQNDTYTFGNTFKRDTILPNYEPIVIIENWYYDNFITDTIYLNTIKPQIGKSDSIIKLTKDSFGQIIEKRLYFPVISRCGDLNISEDILTRQVLIKYDKKGNEESKELFNSSGLLIETIKYSYMNSDLLLLEEEIFPKTRYDVKNRIWQYEYEFYK
jgi:hypothetical protein